MAGGGAAASALSSPWRTLLQRALEVNAHLKHSTFFQLATVGGSGRPANRTVVFRWPRGAVLRPSPPLFTGFDPNLIFLLGGSKNTVIRFRSIRMDEPTRLMRSRIAPSVSISGSIDVIDGSSPDPAKLQQREKAWYASSVKSRSQYLGPCPGVPVADDVLVKDAHLNPSAGPVDVFCLLVLDPENVRLIM